MILFAILTTCASKDSNHNIEGLWEGKLKFPGFETRIIFKIKIQSDGKYSAILLKPDENDKEIPVSSVFFNDSNLRLKVDPLKGLFEGQLKEKDGIITGQWQQGRLSKPLVLKKVTKIVKLERPQTPVPPYPYNEKEVTFTNKKAGAILAGTLTLPNKGENFPAVILISGGGAHDRDYTIFRHRPFLVLADYLTRRGIAVLRFDERGVGASTGDRSQANSEDFAFDVLAGFELLKNCKEIDLNKIGLIGHSEGGTIASIAAAHSSNIFFIVMLGSPGLPGDEYHYQFEETTGRALGLSAEIIAQKRALQEQVLQVVIHEKNQDTAKNKLNQIYNKFIPQIPEAQKQAAIKRFLSPWFRFAVTHDPGLTLQSVKCPVLAIFGEKDLHVPPEGNLNAIKHALETGGNTDYKVLKLAGLNHFFQNSETGVPFEYGKIEETISPTVLEIISNWIIEHTKEQSNE